MTPNLKAELLVSDALTAEAALAAVAKLKLARAVAEEVYGDQWAQFVERCHVQIVTEKALVSLKGLYATETEVITAELKGTLS